MPNGTQNRFIIVHDFLFRMVRLSVCRVAKCIVNAYFPITHYMQCDLKPKTILLGVCQRGQQHIWRSDMCFAAFESLLQIDVARVFLTNLVFILIVIDDLIFPIMD